MYINAGCQDDDNVNFPQFSLLSDKMSYNFIYYILIDISYDQNKHQYQVVHYVYQGYNIGYTIIY